MPLSPQVYGLTSYDPDTRARMKRELQQACARRLNACMLFFALCKQAMARDRLRVRVSQPKKSSKFAPRLVSRRGTAALPDPLRSLRISRNRKTATQLVDIAVTSVASDFRLGIARGIAAQDLTVMPPGALGLSFHPRSLLARLGSEDPEVRRAAEDRLLQTQLEALMVDLMVDDDADVRNEGLKLLLLEYGEMAQRVLMQKFPSANLQDVQDARQEAALRVARNIHLYDPAIATLATWFLGIMRHTLIDAYRKGKKLSTVSLDALCEDGDFDFAALGPGLAEMQFLLDVELALEMLSADELWFLEIDELSQSAAESAESVGMPVAGVYALRARIREKLQRVLKRAGYRVKSRKLKEAVGPYRSS